MKTTITIDDALEIAMNAIDAQLENGHLSDMEHGAAMSVVALARTAYENTPGVTMESLVEDDCDYDENGYLTDEQKHLDAKIKNPNDCWDDEW